MTRTILKILAIVWASLFFLVPARADTSPTPVTPELVCQVQHAIRWRAAAWPDWMCLRVSEAINAAAEKTDQRADLILAIAINESDMRPGVERWYGRDESGRRSPVPMSFGDFGLMGIRCHLGADMICDNGFLRGWKYPAAMQIENNVLIGARILAAKPKLNDYNGGHGYAERIYAITAALGGVRVHVESKRVRKLIGQILAALSPPVSLRSSGRAGRQS